MLATSCGLLTRCSLQLAFASYFVGYAVSVARWRVLLAVQGIRPRFSYLYWSFMIGVFFNQLLPTTIGGDVARYQYTAAGGRGAALSAVLLDRVFGTVSLMVFAMAGLALACSGNETLPQGLLRPVAALLVVGLLILGVRIPATGTGVEPAAAGVAHAAARREVGHSRNYSVLLPPSAVGIT